MINAQEFVTSIVAQYEGKVFVYANSDNTPDTTYVVTGIRDVETSRFTKKGEYVCETYSAREFLALGVRALEARTIVRYALEMTYTTSQVLEARVIVTGVTPVMPSRLRVVFTSVCDMTCEYADASCDVSDICDVQNALDACASEAHATQAYTFLSQGVSREERNAIYSDAHAVACASLESVIVTGASQSYMRKCVAAFALRLSNTKVDAYSIAQIAVSDALHECVTQYHAIARRGATPERSAREEIANAVSCAQGSQQYDASRILTKAHNVYNAVRSGANLDALREAFVTYAYAQEVSVSPCILDALNSERLALLHAFDVMNDTRQAQGVTRLNDSAMMQFIAPEQYEGEKVQEGDYTRYEGDTPVSDEDMYFVALALEEERDTLASPSHDTRASIVVTLRYANDTSDIVHLSYSSLSYATLFSSLSDNLYCDAMSIIALDDDASSVALSDIANELRDAVLCASQSHAYRHAPLEGVQAIAYMPHILRPFASLVSSYSDNVRDYSDIDAYLSDTGIIDPLQAM